MVQRGLKVGTLNADGVTMGQFWNVYGGYQVWVWRVARPALLVLLSQISIACKLDMNIKNLAVSPSAPSTLDKASVQDFTSGGGAYRRSPVRNYLVLDGVGQFQSEAVVESARGYRLYSSGQGVVISTTERRR